MPLSTRSSARIRMATTQASKEDIAPTWENDGLVVQTAAPMQVGVPADTKVEPPLGASSIGSMLSLISTSRPDEQEAQENKNEAATHAMLRNVIVENELAGPTQAPAPNRRANPCRGGSRSPSSASYSLSSSSRSSSTSSSTRARGRRIRRRSPLTNPPLRHSQSPAPRFPPGSWGPPPLGVQPRGSARQAQRSFAVYVFEAANHQDFDLEGLIRAVGGETVTLKGMALFVTTPRTRKEMRKLMKGSLREGEHLRRREGLNLSGEAAAASTLRVGERSLRLAGSVTAEARGNTQAASHATQRMPIVSLF